MKRIELINQLEFLLRECFKNIDILRGPEHIKENDARVTFFKHIVNVINSTFLFLIMSKKYLVKYDNSTNDFLQNEDWWKDIQKEYDLSDRPFPFDRQLLYYDQVVTFSFLILMFSSFESSISLITKQYDATLYQSQKDYGFNSLCKELMRKLKLLAKENDKFIDLIGLLRNSIHNNGAYMPLKSPKKPCEIKWNNTVFRFVEKELISPPQLWPNLISFSKVICKIFTDIINSSEIKKIGYYHDPAELVVNNKEMNTI
jgi:hypothetical protein